MVYRYIKLLLLSGSRIKHKKPGGFIISDFDSESFIDFGGYYYLKKPCNEIGYCYDSWMVYISL